MKKSSRDEIIRRFSVFARDKIAPGNYRDVSELWPAMAGAGLFRAAAPLRYGGFGASGAEVFACGEALVRQGHDLGVALSWAIQVGVTQLIMKFGTAGQKRDYLSRIASGDAVSLAFSEPGVGAHPKFLETRAGRVDSHFVLNGKKSFLTNGPFAAYFLVLAVTGSTGSGRKIFDAFLIPRHSAGLALTEKLDLKCLYSSPHCGLELNDCKIPASARLGHPGAGYEISLAFRELEDVFLLGPVAGGMGRELEECIESCKQAVKRPAEEIGRMKVLLDTVRFLAIEAAGPGKKTGIKGLSLHVSFRSLAREFQAAARRIFEENGCSNPATIGLARDLDKIIDLVKNLFTLKQKKLGEGLFSGKDQL